MRSPVATCAPIRRRLLAMGVDGVFIATGMALLWLLDVGRLDWPHGPYDWIDELGTLFGEHMPRLAPPLCALVAVSTVVQLIGRATGQGTSAGERVAGLRLLDREGRAPSLVKQGVRTIVGVLTGWSIGGLMSLADEEKQTLAEHVSGTRLVRSVRPGAER